MSHTPGPWESAGRVVIEPNDDAVAVMNVARPIEQAEADARLIAAAPDLLSIALRWAAIDAGQWHGDRYVSEAKQLRADTAAAIAKATQP